MILYHYDRNGSLKNGQIISLQSLESLTEAARTSAFVQSFTDGVSSHGANYLDPNCSYLENFTLRLTEDMLSVCTTRSIEKQKLRIDSILIEFVFELVRRERFPDCPSRYTSFFAVDSLSEFTKWPELISNVASHNGAQCCYFNAPDNIRKFDSSWLKGGLNFGLDDGKYFLGFLSWPIYDYAVNYWSGHASDSPRWEYLVSLPIPEIHIMEFEQCFFLCNT